MGLSTELVERIRHVLAGRPGVREVKMFGGLAFMVDDRMVVCARRDGDLLVRVDHELVDQLLRKRGAGPAAMGAGQPMRRNWIAVSQTGVETDEDLRFWVGAALEVGCGTRPASDPAAGPHG